MHRFYISDKLSETASVSIKGPEARHIKDVLRLKAGDQLLLFDGSGFEFTGKITGIGKELVSVAVAEAIEGKTESPVEIILGQGIPKSDKMDMIVQKSTELGVSRIVPIFTERVVPKSFGANKIERWQRIAVEACKQSGRVKVPVICEPVSIDQFVKDVDQSSLRLIPWEGEKERSLKKALPVTLENSKITFIVGPEGGLTGTEIEVAEKGGFIPVSLGRRILRTETVPLALLSIVQHLYGDLG